MTRSVKPGKSKLGEKLPSLWFVFTRLVEKAHSANSISFGSTRLFAGEWERCYFNASRACFNVQAINA